MENKMSALQKLQEKIEQWKQDHEALKNENINLKSQLDGAANAAKDTESLTMEIEVKASQCASLEETIAGLKNELSEKDAEIEKIIAQVESLLA